LCDLVRTVSGILLLFVMLSGIVIIHWI